DLALPGQALDVRGIVGAEGPSSSRSVSSSVWSLAAMGRTLSALLCAPHPHVVGPVDVEQHVLRVDLDARDAVRHLELDAMAARALEPHVHRHRDAASLAALERDHEQDGHGRVAAVLD